MKINPGRLVRWVLLGAYFTALCIPVVMPYLFVLLALTHPGVTVMSALALGVLAAQLLFLWTLSESPLHQPLPLRRRWLAPLVAAAVVTELVLGVGLALSELANLRWSREGDIFGWAALICTFGGTWWLCFRALGRHARYRVALWITRPLLAIAPVAGAACWAIPVHSRDWGWFIPAGIGAGHCVLVAVWAAGVRILLLFVRARYRRETSESPERRWALGIVDVLLLVLFAGNAAAAVTVWDGLAWDGLAWSVLGRADVTGTQLAGVALACWLGLVYRFLHALWRWERAE